jgi:hypothetical protein
MKKYLLSAAFVGAAMLAAPASAAVYVLGSFTVPPTQVVAITPADAVAVGGFQDEFRFEVLAPITLTASGLNTTAIGSIGNLDFGLVELRSGLGTGGSVVASYTNGGDVNGFETTNLGALQLGAGFYTIVVNGTVVGAPARYDGNITFAAVPEPATWAMMVGGFGLLGAAARRSTRAKAVLA